jgi:hypothetical protein
LVSLGRHILESRYAVETFHKEIQVEPAILERYAGEYEWTPSFKIAVTREEGRLQEGMDQKARKVR